MTVHKVSWTPAPAEHDFPAAAAYLSLLARPDEVDTLVALLRVAPNSLHKAKDILRASALRLLGKDNPRVASDLARIAANKALSPILLVRGNLEHGTALQIVDGYHRVCAVYHADEDADIPCRIVSPADVS